MMKRFWVKCISLALAALMIFGTAAYASETDAYVVEDNPTVNEISEETYAAEIAEAADVPVEAEDAVPEDRIDAQPEGEAETDAAIVDNDVLAHKDFAPSGNMTGIVEPGDAEILVGSYGYDDLTLGTAVSFTCTSDTDYKIYTFTPTKSGTYRLETSGTTGTMNFEMMSIIDTNAVTVEFENSWNGVYLNEDMVVNAQLNSGKTYVFGIYPTTNRKDSGKFKLTKTTEDIKSATIKRVAGKSLKVGPTGKGEWDIKSDGTTNYDVWLFGYDELLSLYTMTIYFTGSNQSITWSGADGPEIGDTGLIVVPLQITNNWKLDEKAYCYLYCSNMILGTKQEIPYTDPLFTDVRDSSHPYYKAIYWAANKGITKGYDDGSFGINLSCTRGHAVMFLWRLAGKPAPKTSSKSPFKDVAKTHAYYRAILWASQKGITKGYSDGTFKPDQTCTRGQIMMFIWRYKGKPAPKTVSKSPFKDVAKIHAYYKAILWGSQKGITKGFSDGTFGINKNCTRGQIVTFIYRMA